MTYFTSQKTTYTQATWSSKPCYQDIDQQQFGNENYADVRCEGIISQFSVVQGSY